MRRISLCVAAAAFLCGAPALALAQADAHADFAAGKKAYEAEEFDKALALFQKAAGSDPNNPEVHLWLGMAHHQLGQLDKAIAAWRRTLRLAPKQAYATRMLRALRAQVTGTETRIELIRRMLTGRLWDPARVECGRLLGDGPLTDAQRADVLALQAEAMLALRKPSSVPPLVLEIRVKHPGKVDAVRLDLLTGRAGIQLTGRAFEEGLALLGKIAAEQKGEPAATAKLELLRLQIGRLKRLSYVGELVKWHQANPTHPAAPEALELLISSHLALTANQPAPKKDTPLSASDVRAIGYVQAAQKRQPPGGVIDPLLKSVVDHLQKHYAARGAYAAAADGCDRLLKLELPASCRRQVLRALTSYRAELAMRELGRLAATGKLPAQMPGSLRSVVALLLQRATDKAFPADGAWGEQAALAERVRRLADQLPAPTARTTLSPPLAWAVELALPVIRADADAKAVAVAMKTVTAVRKAAAGWPKPVGLWLPLDISKRLLAVLTDERREWPAAVMDHVDLLHQAASWQFAENRRTGQSAKNAQLSADQTELLSRLAELCRRHPATQAGAAVKKLSAHLSLWLGGEHFGLVEQAYVRLAEALPPRERRDVLLAIAELWIRQVRLAHARLQAVGFRVPAKLDPTLVKALKRCRELQAGLAESDAFLAKARKTWLSVVNHYNGLEHYATAAEAIAVKADPPVAAAQRYAELQLAEHRHAEAKRQLARLLREYDGKAKVAMTPAFTAALGAYRAFITKHGASPLAAKAVSGVFSIAQTFEAHDAHTVAAAIYKDFAAFAAKAPTLAGAAPGRISTAERAELAHAAALEAHARKLLAKDLADRKDKTPPAELRAEFAAAIGAYKQFIAARPSSSQVAAALGKIMAVALEYAKADAWDVAAGVFADLKQAGLPLSAPERIELCRGLCELGKVMPDHARSVLTALVKGQARPGGGRSGAVTLAGVSLFDDYDYKGWKKGGGKAGAKKPAPTGSPRPVPSPPGPAATGGPGADSPFSPSVLAESVEEYAKRDESDLLAMAAIRRQHALRARQVAMMRDKLAVNQPVAKGQQKDQQQIKQSAAAVKVLSDAELARQQKAVDAAYKIFQAIRRDYPQRPTASQARGEILVMIGHWRSIAQWRRSSELGRRYLADNQADIQLPQLRLGVARDVLAWASQPVTDKTTRQEKLAEVLSRFTAARKELTQIVKDFASDRSLVRQAQWDVANSFLTQARVVGAFSPTLARGQYVRAARELLGVAEAYHDHPKISTIPQMLWNIADELARRRYHDEAMIVWNDLTIQYPTHSLSQQAAMRIAKTFDANLGRPLRAAEAYLEINFARGGSDRSVQDAIYAIGMRLKGQKRWVEALHVLETFVDSFPQHSQAGQALTTIGHIHQTNEAWEDAIAAYRRVISEFPAGNWIRDAKWSIAECRINLSQWREAMEAYRAYVSAYAKDKKIAEANRRLGVLKDLARYQVLVDEKGQRKAFDAQHQIAQIVQSQLSNPAKAIIEYRKVATNWSASHLADDALFALGTIYLSIGETAKGRAALLELAEKYADSPLADDALYKVGQSYEAEAQRFAGVTRDVSIAKNKEKAQKEAYRQVQSFRRGRRGDNVALVAQLRKEGKKGQADVAQAKFAAQELQYNYASTLVAAQAAEQQVETLTAAQLADRQDKINAALRRAVTIYQRAAKVAAADKADEALLLMARIYDEKLKDADAAMTTWLEIVRQFSGTAVAEDASWRIAQYYERRSDHARAIEAYKAFVRNYRRSTRAAAAQFAVAESYEHLGQWVKAMDAYTNYINTFPSGSMVKKAREQINWIKTYRL